MVEVQIEGGDAGRVTETMSQGSRDSIKGALRAALRSGETLTDDFLRGFNAGGMTAALDDELGPMLEEFRDEALEQILRLSAETMLRDVRLCRDEVLAEEAAGGGN